MLRCLWQSLQDQAMNITALEQRSKVIENTKKIQATKIKENHKHQEQLMESMKVKHADSIDQLGNHLTSEIKDTIASLFVHHLNPTNKLIVLVTQDQTTTKEEKKPVSHPPIPGNDDRKDLKDSPGEGWAINQGIHIKPVCRHVINSQQLLI